MILGHFSSCPDMKYQTKAGAPEKQRTACLVLAVFERRKLSVPAQAADAACDGALAQILARGDIDGKSGQTLLLQAIEGIAADRVLLVGCGKQKSFDARQYLKAQATAAAALGALGAKDCLNTLTLLEISGRDKAWAVQHAVLAMDAQFYRFDELKSEKAPARTLKTVQLAISNKSKALEQALSLGVATAAGVALSMDLGNRPGNLCTPTDLAEQGLKLANQYKTIDCRVLEEKEMEKLGMGALLSVSRGSREPAKLIVMEYKGGDASATPIALVGKGLTFDAGGISIKPSARMEEMKFDMCGGATVFGVFQALAESDLPLHVVGVVPSSENLPDGAANKPGDVVTSMAGLTIEVINTDAEGRLILCDALTYTQREYKPRVLIDMATLTGACVVALGEHATGLFANNQELAQNLLDAGEQSCDRAWQMPLWEDYQAQIKSTVADIANVGGPGAGAITAACFLHRFTKQANWAHLDIAGTAWTSKKYSTGRPVPLLMQYLAQQAK